MKTILVATDFNDLATAALRQAVPIARATGAEIIVLYADRFEPPAEFTARQADSLVEAIAESRLRAAEELDRYAREIVPEDVKFSTLVREDLPATAIVDLAEERDADLIVMGTHGRGGLARVVLGSVTEAVRRQTKRPVLTITRTGATPPIRKVACADASASPFAADLVRRLDATFTESHDEADLIVVCESNLTLVRKSRVPVLTVKDAGEPDEHRWLLPESLRP